MPSPLASSMSRRADSRTWPTLPGGSVQLLERRRLDRVDDDQRRALRAGELDDAADLVLGDDAHSAAAAGPSSRPSRDARSRTCAADSSPDA